ncbi:MAG: hypothetical protein WCK42_06980 [Myxococcaceae bacterium]
MRYFTITVLLLGSSLSAQMNTPDAEMTAVVSVPRPLGRLIRIGPMAKPFLELFQTLGAHWFTNRNFYFPTELVCRIFKYVDQASIPNLMRAAYHTLPIEIPDLAFPRTLQNKLDFENLVTPDLQALNSFPRNWLLFSLLSLLTTSASLVWASWEVFTPIAIVGLWLAILFPYYAYQMLPIRTSNPNARWLLWLLSRGKHSYDI